MARVSVGPTRNGYDVVVAGKFHAKVISGVELYVGLEEHAWRWRKKNVAKEPGT